MHETDTPVRTILRIPGNWSHPGELVERLPAGYRLTPEALVLPDGEEIEFIPMPPDKQFAQVFRTACRRPPRDEELDVLDGYTVNVGLTGPGGSIESALTMMRAGAAVVRAGAAGVFIDNSALAHGGADWIEMADDGGSDAISFAFVSIVRGQHEMFTLGMHVVGLADLVMRTSDVEEDGETIVDVIRYACQGDHPIGDGHLLADLNGPRFQAVTTKSSNANSESPMYNPFGRLKLVSVKDIAEGN